VPSRNALILRQSDIIGALHACKLRNDFSESANFDENDFTVALVPFSVAVYLYMSAFLAS
jgi:hypothetical protein